MFEMKHPKTGAEAVKQTLDKIENHIADLKANGKDAGFPFGTFQSCSLCQLVRPIARSCADCPLIILFPEIAIPTSQTACMNWKPKRFKKTFSLIDSRDVFWRKPRIRNPRNELRWFKAAHKQITAAAKKKGWIK